MRSGNGRHRRPRQAPAALVAVGVTGAGIALPLLGASGAYAADATTWDSVAECESGGLWSANPHNGYYGGLQLTLETWEQYGGTAYAERPDLASRGGQIAVAEKILAAEGPSAWGCSDEGGLLDLPLLPGTGESAEPEDTAEPTAPEPTEPEPTEPEPTEPEASEPEPAEPEASEPEPTEPEASEPEPTEPEPTDEPAAGETAEPPAQSPSPTPSPTVPEDAAEPSADPAPEQGTGRHRGEAEEDRVSGEHHNPGGHPSTGSGRDAGEADRGEEERDGGTYTVRPGDSLSRIAAEHGVDGGWSALYTDNRDTVGSDPDLIRPGVELTL